MKIMRFLLCIVIIHFFTYGYSQYETSTWLIDNALQIDFVGDSILFTHKGVYPYTWYTSMPMNNSCICDSNGSFLFATNAEWIINANNDTMPSGYLQGDKSSGQSIIVPKPSYPGHYFIFTVGRYYSMTDFRYSEVDMSLDSGLGDIISSQSNILLQTGITDKVTAVKHVNGRDIWVISHENNNNTFVAYLVTREGVSSNPVITNIGTTIVDTPPYNIFHAACQGNIKCSPCGRKIALASKGMNLLQILDFDTESGKLSNPIQLNIPFAYFLEFSGDGNVLYCSTEFGSFQTNDTMKIFQVNLLEQGSIGIINSMYRVNNPQLFPEPKERPAIQLAEDGKIYVSYKFQSGSPPHFGVINSPELVGFNCDFIHDQYITPPSLYGTNFNGFPNFLTSFFDKNVFATTECYGDSTMFYTLNRDIFDSIRWEINDPVTGLHVFHNQDTIYHLYSQPGKYTVHCFRYRDQYVDDFEKKVQVVPYTTALLQDTNICIGEQVELSYSGNFGNQVYWYRQQLPGNLNWELVDSGQVISIEEEGYYYPETGYWDVCGDQPDTAFVNVVDIDLSFAIDTFSGNCITNKYFVTPAWNFSDVDFYQWSTGSYWPYLLPDSPGVYSFYASGFGCEEEDSVYVFYDEPLDINLGPDLQLCDNNAWLQMNVNTDDYFWFPGGETTQGIMVEESGQYTGMATNACGDFSDTVNVLIGETPPEIPFLDTVICAGDSLLSQAPDIEASYLWSTGDTVPNIYMHEAGNYTLAISNFCGNSIMEVDLSTDSLLELNLPDTVWLTNGDSSLLNANVIATSYLWSTGWDHPWIWLSDTGLYVLTVNNACGNFQDSVYTAFILSSEIIADGVFKIYPNPVTDKLNIESYINIEMVYIFDITGKLLSSHNIFKKQVCVEFNLLSQGIYIIKVEYEHGQGVYKVIKE